ncbi:VOC family protein [uncultured Roseibium sp.]|uniref:VOC family protein n=1 Tax=uncultured Roseibium sp. TaxID=1936171 RepID=UPI0032166DA3
MTVKRIVTNIASPNVGEAARFYGDVLGIRIVMDHGWIQTFAAEGTATPQISIASEGGAGTEVPDLSVEVDNLDQVLERARSGGFEILYGPAIEPWGVRRFFVRDPFGRVVNILQHQ